MRKILTIIMLLAFRSSAEVWFVPGWRTGFTSRAGSVEIIQAVYPERKVLACTWDSVQPYPEALRNSRAYAALLLDQIIAMPESRRRELILIGHSIGGDMVLDILSKLAKEGKVIHSAALLGAAVPCDDPRIYAALDAVRFEVCSVFNRHDWVLKYLYPLDDDRVAPLGYAGWTGRHPRFFETGSEAKLTGFFNHYAYLYVETWRELVRTLPRRVEVKQSDANFERRPADMIFWQSVETFAGWQLQRHYSGKCRIVDASGIRRASGTADAMRRAFEDVKAQLTR